MSSLSDSEVLGLLNGESIILDIARELTSILRAESIHDAAVVGGVAVFLHGHRRVTVDIDVRAIDSARIGNALTANGFVFHSDRREFVKRNVPVHMVTPEHIPSLKHELIEIDGIRTVSLADLIDMKLRSGLAKVTRAQDLADVIALIRVRGLTEEFAAQISREVRPEFRKLVAAVCADDGR